MQQKVAPVITIMLEEIEGIQDAITDKIFAKRQG